MIMGIFVIIENIFFSEIIQVSTYAMFVGAHFGAIIIPLIEIHIEKKKLGNDELSVYIYIYMLFFFFFFFFFFLF